MKIRVLILILFAVNNWVSAQTGYFPPKGTTWEHKDPSSLKVNENKLREVVDFAMENEYSEPRDLRLAIIKSFAHEPYHRLAGPVKERGGPAGLILKNGYIIAEWGDIDRVDMTFSVTKSYLSTLAGLALNEGLIASVQDKVGEYVWDGTFRGTHNAKITWHHLLNQSSDWSGQLFGMYDWADRPPAEGGIDEWKNRTLKEPGTSFKYNDVRVNVLAYSLLQVWRKPLPQVLKEKVMDPIGASTTWRWYGYDHAWVTLDGLSMQSVTGGGHSGGGIFISARDHARFGLLFLNKGKWNNQQIIPEQWVSAVQQPSEANPSYGYMWWLNQGNRAVEGVSNQIFYAAGFGGNFIIIDKANDLVAVTRWLEPSKFGEFLQLLSSALKK